MRLLLSLVLVASLFVPTTGSVFADENTGQSQMLEGEFRIHPKYLYKYYVAFGDGQTCALYSASHQRDDEALGVLRPGAKVRVRGILGTEFHRSTATTDNPSPFNSAWVLYMDVESVELLQNLQPKRPETAVVKVGMTFQEVVNTKGQHYRPYVGARVGSLVLVYDDISVEVFDYVPGSKTMRGRVQTIQKTNWESAALLLKDTPYADEKATGQQDMPELSTGQNP